MVLLTPDWDGFKRYAENCRFGSYQIKETVEGLEVRVKAGRFGFTVTFKDAEEGPEQDEVNFPDQNKNDMEFFDEIMKFCKVQNFTPVIGSIPDEQFHS